ncbi:sigma-70 family RNA polymerase sigma factor [Amycolatopsis sp. NPDC054798]
MTRSITLSAAAHRGPVAMFADRVFGSSAAAVPLPKADPEPDAAEVAKAEAWELVRAAQAGDSSAFGQLYDRYVDVVYRYALFRLGDRDLAEDVTSETFLRALRRITSVSYQGRDVGAWFVTIARNLILDHVKSSRFRLEVVTDEVAEPGGVPGGPVGPVAQAGPEQQAIAGATRAELLRCVAELGDDQRECIVLRFLQGLSVAETAQIMDRNEGAVKALQHRAVRRLAQLLPTGLR